MRPRHRNTQDLINEIDDIFNSRRLRRINKIYDILSSMFWSAKQAQMSLTYTVRHLRSPRPEMSYLSVLLKDPKRQQIHSE